MSFLAPQGAATGGRLMTQRRMRQQRMTQQRMAQRRMALPMGSNSSSRSSWS
jgi:hypothetical protein